MAGHSHSANIAHRKGLVDAKRAKLFTKLCRAVYVAARNGGGDPAANMRLRYSTRRRSASPKYIERSVKKATGEQRGLRKSSTKDTGPVAWPCCNPDR